MESKEIKVTCTSSNKLKLNELTPFQGELKKISKQNLEKLKRSIIKYGITVPGFVWQNNGKNYIIDMHQRLIALTELEKEGWIVPEIPVDFIEAKNEKEAKEKLLHITSQYGDFTKDGFENFIIDINLKLDNLQNLRLKGMNIFKNENETKYKELYELIIEFQSMEKMESLYNKLIKDGYKCRISTL